MWPEMVPILKGVVTLHAKCGSPLKNFTFSKVTGKVGTVLELIERDGSFTMENIALDREADGQSDKEFDEEFDEYLFDEDPSDKEAGGFKLDI